MRPGDGAIAVVDTTTNTVTTTIHVGQPSGVAISPDGTTIYVTHRGDGTLWVIDFTFL